MYIIIKEKKIWIEHTAYGPNQGYEEKFQTAITFDSYAEFAEEVKRAMLAKEVFTAYQAHQYKVTAEVKISIEGDFTFMS